MTAGLIGFYLGTGITLSIGSWFLESIIEKENSLKFIDYLLIFIIWPVFLILIFFENKKDF